MAENEVSTTPTGKIAVLRSRLSDINGSQGLRITVLGALLLLTIATILACQYTERIAPRADGCSFSLALVKARSDDGMRCNVALSRDFGSICLGVTSIAGVVLWLFTGAVLRDFTDRLVDSGIIRDAEILFVKTDSNSPKIGRRRTELDTLVQWGSWPVLTVLFTTAWLILRRAPGFGAEWWAHDVTFGMLWVAIGVTGATCSGFAARSWWRVWRRVSRLLDHPTDNFDFALVPSREASPWGALMSLVTLKVGGALLSAATLLSSALLVLPAVGTGGGLALEIVVGLFSLYCVFSVATYFPVRRAVRRAHGTVWRNEVRRLRASAETSADTPLEIVLDHGGLPALGFGGVALRSLTIVTTGAAIVRALTLFSGSGN